MPIAQGMLDQNWKMAEDHLEIFRKIAAEPFEHDHRHSFCKMACDMVVKEIEARIAGREVS